MVVDTLTAAFSSGIMMIDTGMVDTWYLIITFARSMDLLGEFGGILHFRTSRFNDHMYSELAIRMTDESSLSSLNDWWIFISILEVNLCAYVLLSRFGRMEKVVQVPSNPIES